MRARAFSAAPPPEIVLAPRPRAHGTSWLPPRCIPHRPRLPRGGWRVQVRLGAHCTHTCLGGNDCWPTRLHNISVNTTSSKLCGESSRRRQIFIFRKIITPFAGFSPPDVCVGHNPFDVFETYVLWPCVRLYHIIVFYETASKHNKRYKQVDR